jgi:hypothetical protein
MKIFSLKYVLPKGFFQKGFPEENLPASYYFESLLSRKLVPLKNHLLASMFF